jgi:hypothetical protein
VRSLTRTAAAVLLVAAGVAYADWVLQLFVPVQADVMTSFISELSATDQPHHLLFRIADLIGGVLLVAAGTLAWLSSRRWPATWVPLIVLGLCITVEAALPLDTTFTFAAMLPKTGTSVWWNRVTEPHGVVSFLETASFLVLFVTGTRALRRTSVPVRRRRTLTAVGLTAVLLGVIDAALTASLLLGGGVAALGLTQRLGVTLTAAWLAAAPTQLLLSGTRDPRAGAAELGRARAMSASR